MRTRTSARWLWVREDGEARGGVCLLMGRGVWALLGFRSRLKQMPGLLLER